MPPTTATSRHRRTGSRRDPAIDAAVLAAARRLLVEHGYAGTSIDLIATTAGVSRPAVYRRWESKAHLVHAAVFPDLDADAPCDALADEIVRLCHGAVRMYADPAIREAIPGLLHDLRGDDEMRRLISGRLEAAVRAQLAQRLADAVDQQAVRASVSADTLLDAIAGGAWYAVCVREVSDPDATATELAEMILRGILR